MLLLEARLAVWTQQVVDAAMAITSGVEGRGAALDGKTLRMSRQCGATNTHLLSLFSHRGGVVLGEVAVADRINEIAAGANALALLMLTGMVVTGDAGALV